MLEAEMDGLQPACPARFAAIHGEADTDVIGLTANLARPPARPARAGTEAEGAEIRIVSRKFVSPKLMATVTIML
jgi:hypothetical protein